MRTSTQLKKKMSKSKYWKFQPNEVLMECNVASIVSESSYGVLVHKIVFLGNIGDYFWFWFYTGIPCSFFYNML